MARWMEYLTQGGYLTPCLGCVPVCTAPQLEAQAWVRGPQRERDYGKCRCKPS